MKLRRWLGRLYVVIAVIASAVLWGVCLYRVWHLLG